MIRHLSTCYRVIRINFPCITFVCFIFNFIAKKSVSHGFNPWQLDRLYQTHFIDIEVSSSISFFFRSIIYNSNYLSYGQWVFFLHFSQINFNLHYSYISNQKSSFFEIYSEKFSFPFGFIFIDLNEILFFNFANI